MGDLISLDLFRDRRKTPVESIPHIAGVVWTNNSLHEHLRTMHAWGGPKSANRTSLDRVHENAHSDPPHLQMGKPHTHG